MVSLHRFARGAVAIAIPVLVGCSDIDGPAADDPFTDLSAWSQPENLGTVVNLVDYDTRSGGISMDGMSLYFQSIRPGGKGGFDIWVTHRQSVSSPWEAPRNVASLNSAGLETNAYPTPDGRSLFFTKGGGTCGNNDLYVATRENVNDDLAWGAPVNLGCVINSSSLDAAPVYLEDARTGKEYLYFSSNRPGGPGDNDFYVSTRQPDGTWGAAVVIPEISTIDHDNKLTIRRDGLELLFSSNRPGGSTALASFNVWSSSRATTSSPWSAPVVAIPAAGLPVLSHDGMSVFMVGAQAQPFVLNDIFVSNRRRGGT
jgi:hypothetical protein